MDNYAIADQLNLLSRLMDIHGENAFKAKSYAAAAFAVEKLPQDVTTMPREKLFAVRGIGESVGKKIVELLETGSLEALQQLVAATPEGVLEMMQIKGLGPKKIHMLWKELHISSIEALEEACRDNRIAAAKGFGAKTQQNIMEAIAFQRQHSGSYLYIQVEEFVGALQAKLEAKYPAERIQVAGTFRRQWDVIEKLEWVTTIPVEKLKDFLQEEAIHIASESTEHLEVVANGLLAMHFYRTSAADFARRLFATSSSPEFLAAVQALPGWEEKGQHESEEALFAGLGLPYIPPYLREKPAVLQQAQQNRLPQVVQTSDIKGLVHSHSNWSDGAHTIEQMARELIALGFEYLVISDHSRAAFYANGLSEERIREQHRYIDELNARLAPFKIFKSIECDILNDGQMDYTDAVLSTFDLVIASIHSNLGMTEEKAMQRLMGAINNPYVTILGHMTGRLLTKRKGYPVDHKAIIDACARNQVVIEINASPQRLDMDWRWVDYALEQNVLLSVNPDAHTLDDFRYIRYGVLVAQKGGLTKEKNLSSFSRAEFEQFLQQRKAGR